MLAYILGEFSELYVSETEVWGNKFGSKAKQTDQKKKKKKRKKAPKQLVVDARFYKASSMTKVFHNVSFLETPSGGVRSREESWSMCGGTY